MIHPAIIECRRLKAGGTVSNHERSFMENVERITERTTETRRVATRLWGVECGAFRASCDLARRQEQSDLTVALERYAQFKGRDGACLFTMQL